MGYDNPLPPHIPILLATLASLKRVEIHSFVLLKKNGDDGENPLLLNTLDLGKWTQIFEVAYSKTPKLGLVRLEEMHEILVDLIVQKKSPSRE